MPEATHKYIVGGFIMEFAEVVKNRYSCKSTMVRRFRQNSWTLSRRRAALRRLLNPQGQRIYVVQSAEGLAKIDEPIPVATVRPRFWWLPLTKTACLSTRVRKPIPVWRMRPSSPPTDAGRDEHQGDSRWLNFLTLPLSPKPLTRRKMSRF